MSITAAEQSRQPTDDRTCAIQFRIFSLLFAIAILFHQVFHDWLLRPHGTLLSLAAIWAALRPSSLLRFAILSGAFLLSLAFDMPMVVNHQVLVGVVALSILGALLLTTPWRLDAEAGQAAFYRAAAPMLRLQVAAMYVMATLPKLNETYFDPEFSCAVSMAGELPFMPSGEFFAYAAIWGTLLIEGGLPVLLFYRTTRLPGIFLGAIFHTVLAGIRFVPFSGFAFSFYALFSPDDIADRLERFRADFPRLRDLGDRVARWASGPTALPLLAGIWLLNGAVAEYEWIQPSVLKLARFDIGRLVFGVFSIGLIGLLVALVLRPWPAHFRRGAFKLAHPVLALAPLLIVLNGLSPYLGLKTHTSFAMFSGLQTEGENWNHLFLPRAMRIFHFQDDLVQIVESDNPRLARYAASGDRFVHFQFQDYVSRNPEIAVSYTHAGRTRRVPRVGDDPELSKRPHFLLRRLMWFRPVRPPAKGVCPY